LTMPLYLLNLSLVKMIATTLFLSKLWGRWLFSCLTSFTVHCSLTKDLCCRGL